MAGVHGEAFYGRIDRVPGLFFVATQFFHINFVPLIPLGTYVIADGSLTDKGFQGKRIGWSGKSVLLGFYRGWVGAAAAGLFAWGLGTVGDAYAGSWLFLVGAVAGFGLSVVAVRSVGASWWLAFLLVMLAGGAALAALEFAPPPAAPGRKGRELASAAEVLMAAMACLGSVTLMRVFDRAGRQRAYELAEELGLPAEAVDQAFGGPPGDPVEDEPAEERFE